MTAFRVRFAPQGKVPKVPSTLAITSPVTESQSRNKKPSHTRQKSHSGCRECRQRKVKCDEAFPSCLRCQRRGSVCQPNLRTSDWHLEVPWLPTFFVNSHPDIKVNEHLMRYWLEATSQMLSVDAGNNPFSFPILKYATVSCSLVHLLQSASAAQEEYFHQPRLSVSLEERGKALIALRKELETQSSPLSHSFLTLLMLGMSSSWMALEPTEYGREHLVIARTVAEMVVKNKNPRTDELDHLTLGTYVYWDMACSFCLDPVDHPIDQDSLLDIYVKEARHKFHAITTHSIDLYYLLGRLGRYCRVVVEQGFRDLAYEVHTERNLKEYQSIESNATAKLLTEAFRKHGLLLLYRFCGKPGASDSTFPTQAANENYAHDLAVGIIELILEIKSSSPYVNIQTIPLMTAGAEMTSCDALKRDQVRQRLREAYSTNRLVSTLWVIDLLEELWELHDNGMAHISWLGLMLSKNWRLRIG